MQQKYYHRFSSETHQLHFFRIAPSSTLSMPCTDQNNTMFGVTAVDLSLSDVFSQVNSFSYGRHSYTAVIDVKGIYNKTYLWSLVITLCF